MQEKVAAMTAAVQEIQKPEQKETPILTNLEMMEKREEEVLEKVKEQKGEIDINDLIMSIDPDALEEEMARQTTIEPIQQTSAETPHLEIPQQARSQIITEEVQPESARMEQATQEAPIQHSEARDLINTQNQETQVPEQGSTEPVAPQQPLGTMIITYFKEIKELVPKEEWSAHPDVRHLAVLAQRYVETKIHPTKEQVHYAKEAVGRLKE
jgi:hypothetical protein